MSRLLLIEDNEENRDGLSRHLRRKGFEVLVAADGRQGLEAARAGAPDLILMDMSLPVLDGWEATRQLKADPQTRHIPVIAVTAFVWDGIARSAAEVGCDGFLAKPFKSADLLREVQKQLSPGKKPEPRRERPAGSIKLQR